MPTPVFWITADGVDVTERLRGGGISLSITDGIAYKSDTVQIVIDDQDGRVRAPSTGTVLNIRGGYLEGLIRDFGDYTVDQIRFVGWPQQIRINAQSVAAASAAKENKSKDYRKEEYPTFEDVFNELADEAGLRLSISSKIGSIGVEYEARGEESPLEFATRIGRKLGATVSVKQHRMIVVPRGSGLSAGGERMPNIVVAEGVNLLRYSVTWMDKARYSQVKATWYDREKNDQMEVTVGTELEGPTFLIREPKQSEDEALRAAKSTAIELKRGQANANFTIDGAPGATAGSMAICSGARPSVDGAWYAKNLVHNFGSDSPYTTDVNCELPDSGAKSSSDGGSGSPGDGSSGSGSGESGGDGQGGSSGSSSGSDSSTSSGEGAADAPFGPDFNPWTKIDLAGND